MATKYILAVLSLVFLTMAAARMMRNASDTAGQARTWLIVGVTFAVISGWLFVSE